MFESNVKEWINAKFDFNIILSLPKSIVGKLLLQFGISVSNALHISGKVSNLLCMNLRTN